MTTQEVVNSVCAPLEKAAAQEQARNKAWLKVMVPQTDFPTATKEAKSALQEAGPDGQKLRQTFSGNDLHYNLQNAPITPDTKFDPGRNARKNDTMVQNCADTREELDRKRRIGAVVEESMYGSTTPEPRQDPVGKRRNNDQGMSTLGGRLKTNGPAINEAK